jgi:hypothetical protein
MKLGFEKMMAKALKTNQTGAKLLKLKQGVNFTNTK